MTPEQLRQLRDQLPPLPEAGQPTPLQRQFCRDYGLDFLAQEPGLDYRSGTVPSGNFSLAVHRWLQAGASANLLLVHGYFDHSGLFGKLVEFGLSLNCNVLIFDLPGHGLSSGEPAAIDDFADYGHAIHAVLAAAQLPRLPLWVMAQSTGCAALVEFARHYSWPFAASVMLAPLVRPASWTSVRIGHSLLRHFAPSIKRKFVVNSSDTGFLDFVQRDPLQSRRLPLRWIAALRRWLATLPPGDLGVGGALIVQGDADQTVDWRYNTDVFRRLFPGSLLELLPGAGHQLANESAALRENYLARVAAYASSCGVVLAKG